MKQYIIVVSLFISAFAFSASAQSTSKHPRVAELEAYLSSRAVDLMRSRFPEKPFLVTVAVDPLHRDGSYGGQAGQGVKADQEDRDLLPLSWHEDDEVLDEWDNPNIPISGLTSRVKKAVVNVAVPQETTDDEIAELQQSIFLSLNLFQARDDVRVQRRSWSQKPTELEPIVLKLIGGIISLVIAAVAVIVYLSARRIARAVFHLSEKGLGGNSSSSSSGVGASLGRSLLSDNSEVSKSGLGASADVRFNDPLKTREVILSTINALLTQHRNVFPSLKDMMQLDRFGRENPSALGALLVELPLEAQHALFGRSSGKHWLDALNEPGDLGPACLDMLQKLVRNSVGSSDEKWEELLIAFWRLDAERASFIRSMDREDSFAILSRVPRSLAVSVAREAFPGGWGVVLDTKRKPRDLSPERIEALTRAAYNLVPLREIAGLERYRQEKDFIDYLHTVEPLEEREVYMATPEDSLIHSMRVPFYPVLSLEADDMKALVGSISLDDWALSMFNVPRAECRVLEKALSDKQRFIFFELLKQIELENPSPRIVGNARQRVALVVDRYLKAKAQAAQAAENEPGEGGGEVQSAA
jgi:hypothetical protein